jgi:hypothetical protein
MDDPGCTALSGAVMRKCGGDPAARWGSCFPLSTEDIVTSI